MPNLDGLLQAGTAALMIMAVALLGRLYSTTRVMTCIVGRAMKGLLNGGQLFHFRCTETGVMEGTQQKHKATPMIMESLCNSAGWCRWGAQTACVLKTP